MADLHHLGRARGPPARRRAARPLRPRRGGEPAAATYSGGMRRRLDLAMTPGRRPAHHLPRRADDRPRPAQPPHDVADHPRPRRRRRHDLPDDAVPRGGRPARRPDRGARPRAGSSPRAPPDELKRLVPGGHIRLRFADAGELDAAARALGEAARDDDALTLQVPSDGGVQSLRAVLDRLDADAIDVDDLSVHTPDLDDVFLALTGTDTTLPSAHGSRSAVRWGRRRRRVEAPRSAERSSVAARRGGLCSAWSG